MGKAFNPKKVSSFEPFKHGCVAFGGYFGDEGKGKIVDIFARRYKEKGLKILSIRGQGSGNAGHTVNVNGIKYDFHYLTSAGLSADIMLLGAGMLIDPVRMLKEANQLPLNKRNIIMVDERATLVTDVERSMDAWCENQRSKKGQPIIGTTKSGVGPGAGNRGYRFNITFADALKCKDEKELCDLVSKNPLLPEKVKNSMTEEYAVEVLNAINNINIVDSQKVIAKCRKEKKWAVLLEVSQAVCLDPLFGNSGHFTTSTPCTDIGAAAFAGLTMYDFPDGSYMVLKAYGSKVGGGPYITQFTEEESNIANFIYDMVGERGVTTGRKRSLGWFDGPAVRHSIQLTGAEICINCIDVMEELAKVTDTFKICYAYRNKITGEIEYDWPYHIADYEPLYLKVPIAGKSKQEVCDIYIETIEKVIGKRVKYIGVGPSNEDLIKRFD